MPAAASTQPSPPPLPRSPQSRMLGEAVASAGYGRRQPAGCVAPNADFAYSKRAPGRARQPLIRAGRRPIRLRSRRSLRGRTACGIRWVRSTRRGRGRIRPASSCTGAGVCTAEAGSGLGHRPGTVRSVPGARSSSRCAVTSQPGGDGCLRFGHRHAPAGHRRDRRADALAVCARDASAQTYLCRTRRPTSGSSRAGRAPATW